MSKNLEDPRSEPGMTGAHGRFLPVALFFFKSLGWVGAGGTERLPEDGSCGYAHRYEGCEQEYPPFFAQGKPVAELFKIAPAYPDCSRCGYQQRDAHDFKVDSHVSHKLASCASAKYLMDRYLLG